MKIPNNIEYAKKVDDFTLDSKLLEETDMTGRIPSSGDVKMFYYTKSGPGPLTLGLEESNLDPKTGLNIYTPKK